MSFPAYIVITELYNLFDMILLWVVQNSPFLHQCRCLLTETRGAPPDDDRDDFSDLPEEAEDARRAVRAADEEALPSIPALAFLPLTEAAAIESSLAC